MPAWPSIEAPRSAYPILHRAVARSKRMDALRLNLQHYCACRLWRWGWVCPSLYCKTVVLHLAL